MKWTILILVLLFPLVTAGGIGDESVITTGITVEFNTDNPEEARITISGENLIWSKSLIYNNTVLENHTTPVGFGDAWFEELEIIMVRRLGNYSDVQYAIIECNEMANFSQEWALCTEQRHASDLQIINEMINRSEYESLENNMTEKITGLETERDNKNNEISELTSTNEKLEKDKKNGWYAGVIGGGVAIWCLYKYKGWGKNKSQFEAEYPSDAPA